MKNLFFLAFLMSMNTIFYAQTTSTFETSAYIGIRLSHQDGKLSFWGEHGGEKWLFGPHGANNNDNFIIFDRVNNAVRIEIDGNSGNFLFREGMNVAKVFSIGNIIVPDGYVAGIKGKLITEEIKIQNYYDWPDFVFAQDYEIQPLDKLERFINKNHHLPNFVSQQEVITNDGIEIGDFNKRLLKTVEELTLYIIELNKRITDLESRK